MDNKFDIERTKHLATMLWNKYEQIFDRSKDILQKNRNVELTLDKSKKEVFINNFCNRYKFVMDTYMDNVVGSLDRHKVAAIAIIEFIGSDILKYDEPTLANNEIFIPKYFLAAQTGLAFMQYWFSNLLESKGLERIDEWTWPKLLSCPQNEYFCVFSRNLYYISQRLEGAGKKYVSDYNELDLAEKLYLIEYITILSRGIDPENLVEDN